MIRTETRTMSDAQLRRRISTQAEAGAALLEFLDARVVALVDQILRERRDDADDPLIRSDRLGPNNRIVLRLIKRGEIRGILIGNRWHVRRSEWARYVGYLEAEQGRGRLGVSGGTSANEVDVDAAADRVLADLGLERYSAASATGIRRPALGGLQGRPRRRRTGPPR